MKRARWSAFVLALPVSLAFSSGAGDDPISAFVNPYGPDRGIVRYATGQLGIPQRDYARIYLIVAYHRLNGRTFTEEQALRLNDVCCSRKSGNEEQADVYSPAPDLIKNWFAARKEIPNAPAAPEFSLHRRIAKDAYSYYLNCHPDALAQAEKTLRARLSSYGASSPWVRNWLTSQDAVFANCGTRPTSENAYTPQIPERTLPPVAAPDEPEIFRKDRDYQLAAAYFYAGDFAEAQARFEKIGLDLRSPWRGWGAYLAVRADLRTASLDPQWTKARMAAQKLQDAKARDEALKRVAEQEATAKTAALQTIERRVGAILADPTLKSVHTAAANLLNAAHAKLRPAQRKAALADRFERGDFNGDFTQDLTDLLLLLRQAGARAEAHQTPTENDLLQWIRVMETRPSGDDQLAEHRALFSDVLLRWRKSRSEWWLYAVASKVQYAEDIERAADSEFLDALHAVALRGNSVGFAYHFARIARLLGRAEEARVLLDRLLADATLAGDVSARNLILTERFALSRNYDEFVEFLIRVPYGEIDRDLGESRRNPAGDPRIGDDAAVVMNMQLPLTVWRRLANDGRLPDAIRRRIASAGWLRSVLLGRERDADVFAKLLQGVSATLDEELALYLRSPRGAAKHRAAMRVIERRSYIRPYVASDAFEREDQTGTWRLPAADEFVTASWWCSLKPDGDKWTWGEPSAFDSSYDTPMSFLSARERRDVAEEQSALRSLPNATDFYVKHVLAWAKARPNDPSLPRMLHVAVRSTRGGCISQDTGTLSYRAFRLLQTKYGASDWAKKTPYWYGTTR